MGTVFFFWSLMYCVTYFIHAFCEIGWLIDWFAAPDPRVFAFLCFFIFLHWFQKCDVTPQNLAKTKHFLTFFAHRCPQDKLHIFQNLFLKSVLTILHLSENRGA